jgi:DNA-binding NarL/FixJ family response regulator
MSDMTAATTTDLARREPRVTCLLGDPDTARAALVRRYLESRGIAVIGTPAMAAELIALAELYRPNVILVDDELAPDEGPFLARVLQARARRSAIIVATDGGDRDALIELLEGGRSRRHGS